MIKESTRGFRYAGGSYWMSDGDVDKLQACSWNAIGTVLQGRANLFGFPAIAHHARGLCTLDHVTCSQSPSIMNVGRCSVVVK